jgi:hypothetical protein
VSWCQSRDAQPGITAVAISTARPRVWKAMAKGSLAEVLMRTSLPDPRAARKTAAFLAMTLPGTRRWSLASGTSGGGQGREFRECLFTGAARLRLVDTHALALVEVQNLERKREVAEHGVEEPLRGAPALPYFMP